MYCFDVAVGDTVVIREWDDMASEFGIDDDGDIETPGPYFICEMAPICGSRGVISAIFPDRTIEFCDSDIPDEYSYSIYMVRPLYSEDEAEPVQIPDADFLSMISFD